VAGVDVGAYVGEVEVLDGVLDAGGVGGLGVLALLDVQVGDEVAETVGLCGKLLVGTGGIETFFFRLTDDERHGDVGVLLEDGGDGVDVGLVLVDAVVGDGVLAVGGQSGTITVGQVVDYEGANDGRRGAGGVLRFDVGQVGVHGGNLGGCVTVCCQIECLGSVKWVTYSQT